MKHLKTVFLLFVLLFSFSVGVCAESADEIYAKQFKQSGADELYGILPENAKNYFEKYEIDPSEYGWINSFSAESVFSHIFRFLKSGVRAPFISFGQALFIIIISAAIKTYGADTPIIRTAVFSSSVLSAAVVTVPIISLIKAGISAIKGLGVFVSGFVPVFGATVAASGMALTSVSMSGLLLFAAEGVNWFSSFVVSPLIGGYFAVSISSAVSPLIKTGGIAEAIKKTAFWIMGLITAIFSGLLAIQTAVNSSADSLSFKTAKFIIGSALPVAGNALSEALSTVTASVGILKSSVGIYGIVVCALTVLPLVLEMIIWRAVLTVLTVTAEIFSLDSLYSLFKSADSVLSVICGIILLITAMFIICFAVVVSAGKV